MEIGHIIPHIEALLFASDKPLTPIDITELINNAFGFMEDKITMEQIQTAMEGIVEKYAAEFYPFELRESGGGWQFLTKKEFHKTVAQLNGDKYLKRLSAAALETLAIIAYKQPITKADIEAIRGVSCDYAVQKLLEKELIVITGRNENLPGKPLVYNTSRTFMDYFGLNSPNDLPKLKEVFNEALIDPTVVNISSAENSSEEPTEEMEESEFPLVVTENGELLEENEITEQADINEEPEIEESEIIEEETSEEEIENTEEDTEEPGEEEDQNDQKEEN
jgi:segregation and condensation protein B